MRNSANNQPYLVKEIIKLWNEGKNLFIVYGSGHAIVQEKALRTCRTTLEMSPP